jgi:predicted metal-dependent hydrolase
MSASVLTIGDLRFDLRLSPRRRSVGITVERDGGLTVSAPAEAPLARVEAAVRSRLFWVYQKLSLRRQVERRAGARAYASGETYAYLGRSHRLLVDLQPAPRQPAVALRDGRLVMRANAQTQAATHLAAWYRQHGQEWLPPRCDPWATRMQLTPAAIVIRDLHNRWGSCTANGEIQFHWQVMTLPPAVIDYIIVHELAHLAHRGHDRAFWATVERTMPDYERRKERLAQHGGGYVL